MGSQEDSKGSASTIQYTQSVESNKDSKDSNTTDTLSGESQEDSEDSNSTDTQPVEVDSQEDIDYIKFLGTVES